MAENLARVRKAAEALGVRPKVYFEEWNDPLISGIRWVSEVVEAAGGEDCFPELAGAALARDRIVRDPDEVIRRAPDIIIGSWCGRRFRPEQVRSRVGWDGIPAVRAGQLFEIRSPLILQPGPAAFTDGLDAVHAIVRRWAEGRRGET
jgi:iron complex transport system substrate-binding protein